MKEFMTQTIGFVAVGGAVYGLSRLLRCTSLVHPVSDAKRSAVHSLIAVAMSMGILSLLMVMQHSRHSPTPDGGPKLHNMEGLIFAQLIVLAIYATSAAVFMHRDKESLESVGITRQNLWQAILIGCFLACVTFFSQAGENSQKLVRLGPGYATASFVYYAMVGFGEEFLFRGYLQSRLRAWLGPWQGWVLASVVMALAHFPGRLHQGMSLYEAVGSSVALIPLSLLMGFVMLRTRNLMAPGIFHTFAAWM